VRWAVQGACPRARAARRSPYNPVMTTRTRGTDALRERLLSALSANRAARLNFPGVFMNLTGGRESPDTLDLRCEELDFLYTRRGEWHLPVIGVIADIALGGVTRLLFGHTHRPATVQLDLAFTGKPLRGLLTARSHCHGLSSDTALHHAIATGVVKAGDEVVAHASGGFVLLALPPGSTQNTDPWLQGSIFDAPALDAAALSEDEQAVLARYLKAQARGRRTASFVEQFWCGLPRRREGRASLTVDVGPHLGNRVGQVHGGILLGLAADVANAAVPDELRLAKLSSCYLSPGQGPRLKVRAGVVQRSRNLAVVRTEIFNADGTRVLETTSQHLRKAG